MHIGIKKAVIGVLLLLCQLVDVSVARDDPQIFAKSINYCGPSQIILVEKFDFILFPRNESVSFSVAASSVPNTVNATVFASLTGYGRTFVNTTTNLCNIAAGILCPLPAYNFNGTAQYFLPENYLSQVPNIAYTVPNLEANLRVQLIDEQTGTEAACLDVTLSNGLTTEHAYVSWAVGAVVILTFLTALIHPLYPIGPSWYGWDYRLFGLVGWLQHIAATGMISVAYPKAFAAFTRNFAWVFGLIYIQPIQESLTSTALKTGGATSIDTNAIQVTQSSSAFADALNAALAGIKASAAGSNNGILTITQNGRYYNITSGLAPYVDQRSIEVPTAFAVSFVVFLLLAAIMIALVGMASLLFIFLPAFAHRRNESTQKNTNFKLFSSYCQLNAFRWFFVALFPLWTLAIFQFRYSNVSGWAMTVIASVIFAVTIISLFGILAYVFLSARRHADGVDGLYEDKSNRIKFLPLVQPFKTKRSWFGVIIVTALFLRAVFIGALQSHGLGQIIALLVVEGIFLLFTIILRPYDSKGNNVLECFLTIMRMVTFGLLIVFTVEVTIDGIIATVIGFVILAVESLVALIFIFNILIRLVTGLIWTMRHKPDSEPKEWLHQDMEERRHSDSDYVPQPTPVVASAAPTHSPHHLATPEQQLSRDSRHSSVTLVDGPSSEAQNKHKDASVRPLSQASEFSRPHDPQVQQPDSSRSLTPGSPLNSEGHSPINATPVMAFSTPQYHQQYTESPNSLQNRPQRHTFAGSPRSSQSIQPIQEEQSPLRTPLDSSRAEDEGHKIWSPSFGRELSDGTSPSDRQEFESPRHSAHTQSDNRAV